MNPLLSEPEQARVASGREIVGAHLVPRVDEIESTGSCPDEVLTELVELVGEAEDLTGLVLTVEEIARVNAAVASVVGAHGAALQCGIQVDGLAAVSLASGVTLADDGGTSVSGDPRLVAGAVYADWLLVAAGEDLFRCARGPGVEVSDTVELLGLRGAGHALVRLSGAAASPAAVATGDLRDTLRIVQAARAVGLAQGALDAALADVGSRRDAGDPIARSQSVQWMLADIATAAESARVSTYYAASQPAGAGRAEAAAMSRLLAAEGAVEATRSALQIAGEAGARRGAVVERLYRDAKLMEIEGGSNEDQLRCIAAHLLPGVPVA